MKPIAEILRPQTLSQYVGQQHLVGEDAVLRKAISRGIIPSIILWGPPGVGKTTLAHVIAQTLRKPFFSLSAINSGVKDIRDVLEKARYVHGAILFIDEIHRFSKSQQDSLLGAVEKGIITLIGATTENPSFEVISPLLSRCQVYILNPLSLEEMTLLMNRGVEKLSEMHDKEIDIKEINALIRISGGDGRKLLNALEIVINASITSNPIVIDDAAVLKILQQNIATYDKDGENHYDIISAFIKSIRGSDPNAAVYWLARMIEGGETPEFIARRLLILAAEDIGLANPNALLLANSCFDAVKKIGWPESRIILSETALYLATSPKSNSAYKAINEAQEMVRLQSYPVPLHLRNAPTGLMQKIGYGKNYQYAHNYKDNFVRQEFFPPELSGTQIYVPGDNVREADIRNRMNALWKEKYQKR